MSVCVVCVALLHTQSSTTVQHACCLTVPGSDYANGDSTTRLVFGRCDRKHCASINIIDNEVLEDPEIFSVRLFRNGLNDYFTVSRQSAIVEIDDDDGSSKYVCRCCLMDWLICCSIQ